MKKGLTFPILALALIAYADRGRETTLQRLRGEHWVTSWAASAQGPFPCGYANAQPVLRILFPDPKAGARDQSFRMVVRPDVWGSAVRIRLSNAYGVKPVTFDDVYIGLQAESEVAPDTNKPVTFNGETRVTVPPASSAWSDAVPAAFADTRGPLLLGRKLAVSFHVPGPSGPVTWHAKAPTLSYISAPGSGSKGAEEEYAAFPFSVSSWFFLDAVDMMMPGETSAVVAFGDSITEGEGTALNTPDRWDRQSFAPPSQKVRGQGFGRERGHRGKPGRGSFQLFRRAPFAWRAGRGVSP